MTRRGFTLVELLVALVMTTIVAGALFQLLVTNQRVYRQQTERVDLNANVRAAVAVLPTELRELDAADTVESDLLRMGDTVVAYKAMRGVSFLCLDPVVTGPTSGTLILSASQTFGLRQIDPTFDSLLVFAENDLSTRTDDYWVHMNVAGAATPGALCGGQASLAVPVNAVYPPNSLADVRAGTPVRNFELAQVLTYADANGAWWLGDRRFRKGTGWTEIQPALGPLAASGLRFRYYDAAGAVTAVPALVTRIGVTVIGQTSTRVSRSGSGRQEYVVDTLVTEIALRNNPR